MQTESHRLCGTEVEGIASQLLGAGHSLVVHDLRPEAARALLNAGAIWPTRSRL
jgi:hypothetical protein